MRIFILMFVAIFLLTISVDGKKKKQHSKKHGKSSHFSSNPCQDCPRVCTSNLACGPNASCVNLICQCTPPLVMYFQMCHLPIGAHCDSNVTSPANMTCVPHAECLVQGDNKVCGCQEGWVTSRDFKSCVVPKGGECEVDDDWETPGCIPFANCVPDVNILGMYTSDEGVCVEEKDEGVLESLRRKSWAQWIVLVFGVVSVFLPAAALVFLHYWRKRRSGREN